MTKDLIFDDFSKLRLLPISDHDHSSDLQATVSKFTQNLSEFTSTLDTLKNTLQEFGNHVDDLKCYAIGSRIKLSIPKRNSLVEKIKQRQMEMDRLVAEVEALERRRDEQRLFINDFRK